MKKKKLSCPYCEFEFSNLPGDKTACPNCEEIIYLYDSEISGEKVLFTEEGLYKIIKMRKKEDSKNYFVERIRELEANFHRAKASTMHYGELGRDLEMSVRKLLEEYLPNKYTVDTGFVRSLEKPDWQSNQIDILLSRNDICYPLATHHEFKVYPLESIISFVEVTSNLTKAKLREDYEKVTDLQRLHKRLYYIPKPPAGVDVYRAYDATHPRFYYFAFSTDWKDPKKIEENILELSNKYRIQLHAMFILNRGYYFAMPNAAPDAVKPFTKLHPTYELSQATIAFLQHILINLQTADFIPPNASIPFGAYFDPNFRLP